MGYRFSSLISAVFHNASYLLFSSPASSFGLRVFLFFIAINNCNKKYPCVSIVWHKLRQINLLVCHTCHIVCTRAHRSSSRSRAAHPLSARRGLAAHRIANHSYRSCCSTIILWTRLNIGV